MRKQTLAEFAAAGIDVAGVAAQLQREGAEAFVKSWNGLMQRIADKAGIADKRARSA